MTASGKVLFRVDANPSVGLGHLQRSLSLAAALRSSDVESVFFSQADDHSSGRVKGRGFPLHVPVTNPWTQQDAQETAAEARRQECESIVVDSYLADANYLSQLRNVGHYVIARDDRAAFPFPCQMVINGNANAPQLGYRSSSGDTDFLLGLEYLILSDEFLDLLACPTGPTVKNILVILGGTDPHHLMPRILDSLATIPGDFILSAVVGPYFRNIPEIESSAEHAKCLINLFQDPSSVADLMIQADLAVSAAGQALYELAATGCPTVAIQLEPTQAGQMDTLEQAGVIKVAGIAGIDDVIFRMNEAVSDLMVNTEARASMCVAGPQMVDGSGATRVAQAIRAATA